MCGYMSNESRSDSFYCQCNIVIVTADGLSDVVGDFLADLETSRSNYSNRLSSNALLIHVDKVVLYIYIYCNENVYRYIHLHMNHTRERVYIYMMRRLEIVQHVKAVVKLIVIHCSRFLSLSLLFSFIQLITMQYFTNTRFLEM